MLALTSSMLHAIPSHGVLGGVATLWEAVVAGVALLAILNAVRIQRIKF
jgi:hypothetical protein